MDIQIVIKTGKVLYSPDITVLDGKTELLKIADYGLGGPKVGFSTCLPADINEASQMVKAYNTAIKIAEIILDSNG